jgi:hypothetical protein
LPRALFIAYFMPPLGGANAVRNVRLLRHLPAGEWEVLVLTCEEGHYFSADTELLRELPEGSRIERVRGFEPEAFYRRLRGRGGDASGQPSGGGSDGRFLQALKGMVHRWLLVPDEKLFWARAVRRRAPRILDEFRPDVLVAVQPNSTLLAGLALGRKRGIPVVMDFQDEWTRRAVGISAERRFPVTLLERRMERRCLEGAARIVCNTPRMAGRFQEDTGLPSSRFPVVANGWEPEDFPEAAPCRTRGTPERVRGRECPLHVVYAGSLYGDYLPEAFVRGWARAVASGALPAEALRATFFGAHERRARERIAGELSAAGLGGCAEFPGPIPRPRLIGQLLLADLLLLCLPDRRGSDSWVPLKTCELLAAGRPLFAELPDGDARDLVRGVGCEALLAPGDGEAAARELGRLHAAFAGGGIPVRRDWERLHGLSWRRLAERLGGVLREAAGA